GAPGTASPAVGDEDEVEDESQGAPASTPQTAPKSPATSEAPAPGRVAPAAARGGQALASPRLDGPIRAEGPEVSPAVASTCATDAVFQAAVVPPAEEETPRNWGAAGLLAPFLFGVAVRRAPRRKRADAERRRPIGLRR